MICAVVLSDNLEEMRAQGLEALSNGASFVECRLDGLQEIDFTRLEQFMNDNNDLPLIFSIRSEWNTEKIAPPISGRIENMKKVISLKPRYVDLEYPFDMHLLPKLSEETIPIISALDFQGMVKVDYDGLQSVAKRYGKEIIVKIGATPHTIADLRLLWSWASNLRRSKMKYIVFGMGSLGQLTRIKSRELGNYWMYGRFSHFEGEPYLPGMMKIDELVSSFSEESWHFACLGNLPENDVLRGVYRLLLDVSKTNGVYLNLPISTSPELDQILLWIEDGLLDGVNISSPWQQDMLHRLDWKDSSAVVMDAVNSVVVTKEGLKGYNTQIEGFKRSLEPFSIKKINRVYIDGTERVSHAVIHVLKDQVETIVIRDKLFSTHHPIFDEYPSIIPDTENFSNDFDLVVNCNKPAQGFENVVMLPRNILEHCSLIFDPMSRMSNLSPLKSESERLGKQYIGSYDFFFNTALASYELWTKKSIPPSMVNAKMFLDFADQIDFGFMLNY